MQDRFTSLLIWMAAVLLAAGAPAWAQNRTSAISGIVTDGSGAAVAGARIVAQRSSTGIARSTVSDESGFFRLSRLELGGYEVTVEMQGFKTGRYQGLTLEIDREGVVNPVLEIGERTESIVVHGQAQVVEAAPSAVTGLVGAATIERLPLNGRDYIQLATLEAGVPAARAVARNVNAGYGVQLSISGSRPSQNGFQLDGVSLVTYSGSTPGSVNGVSLGVDAIEEFSVLTSTFGAEYGRAAGGIINAVTRSGGNEFHGSLFWFHRNDNLDARNFFDLAEPPEFRRHQFGGSLGGPVVRNRSFFFVSEEQLRQVRGNTTIDTTLSGQARQGNLIRGPVAVDPVMARVAALYPLPNGTVFGDTGLFIYSNDERAREDFVTTRFDQNFSDADKLFFRYSFDDGARRDQSTFALGDRSNNTRNQSAVLEHAHILSSRMIASARLGFLRTRTAAGKAVTRLPATDDPDLAFLPGLQAIGIVTVSGLSDFPGGTGALDSDRHIFNSLQPSADVTWLAGRHSWKAGARFERTRFNTDSQNLASGDYRFATVTDLLTNCPNRFRAQLAGSDTVRGHRQWIGSLYVQDTWRTSSRLTLEMGIRWEWAGVPTEVNGKVANLDNLRDPEMRIGDPLFDNPSLANIAPRLGVAWDVFGTGKTHIRAGYGIFPELLLSQYILTPGVRNPPFFLRGVTTKLGQGGFPGGGFAALLKDPNPEYRVERIPRDLSQPYVQQWNFNLVQVLDQNHSLRLAYVGSHGVNLACMTEDADIVEPVRLADGRLFFPADGERINPAFGRIRDRTFNAHSFYHALNTQFRRRLGSGLQAQVAYAFSKSIDDSSNFFAITEASNSISLPFSGDPRFNRGLSGHDVRHYVALSGSWQLPVADGAGWRRVVGGWDTAAIVTYASGLPLSARLAYDAARTKTSKPGYDSGQRPDMAPGAGHPVTGDPVRWVDVNAFLRPVPGFLGNAGRNNIIGPDLATVDLSVGKQARFPWLGEGAALLLRVEAFNLLNRTNFDLPEPQRMEIFSQTSTREDVARISSAGKSREIQFGLKLRF